jgi:hypothetical protein
MMTVPDFGAERPGDPSDTRQLVERGRTESGAPNVSGRAFLIALAVIAALIALLIVLLK